MIYAITQRLSVRLHQQSTDRTWSTSSHAFLGVKTRLSGPTVRVPVSLLSARNFSPVCPSAYRTLYSRTTALTTKRVSRRPSCLPMQTSCPGMVSYPTQDVENRKMLDIPVEKGTKGAAFFTSSGRSIQRSGMNSSGLSKNRASV